MMTINLMPNVAIYGLCDPRIPDTIRYVGKTISTVRRLKEHLVDKTLTRKSKWIQTLLTEGVTPILKTLETCHHSEWESREVYWISYLTARGHSLTNTVDGGAGGRRRPRLYCKKGLHLMREHSQIESDGKRRCRACKAKSVLRWQKANKEKRNATGKKYYEANKEKVAERTSRYYQENKAAFAKRQRDFYKKHKNPVPRK